nr:hypothetical protein HmN_000684100 [Hymenolepis microstoma]
MSSVTVGRIDGGQVSTICQSNFFANEDTLVLRRKPEFRKKCIIQKAEQAFSELTESMVSPKGYMKRNENEPKNLDNRGSATNRKGEEKKEAAL